MSLGFRILVAAMSLLGSVIAFFAGLENERWQIYAASCFFFCVFLSVVTPQRIARIFGKCIAAVILLLCVTFFLDSFRQGVAEINKAVRFSLVYGGPALVFLVFDQSVFKTLEKKKNMIDDLTLEYNKLRQAAITAELLEITTAMKAME